MNRYNYLYAQGYETRSEMRPHPDGYWVPYADAAEALATEKAAVQTEQLSHDRTSKMLHQRLNDERAASVKLRQDLTDESANHEQTRAELERVKDQCNRQEHGFAQRESMLQRDLATAQARVAELEQATTPAPAPSEPHAPHPGCRQPFGECDGPSEPGI